MAGSINIFLMSVFLIASVTLIVASGILCDIPTNNDSPSPSPQLLPTKYHGSFKYLELCSKKFRQECGQKAYFAIFFANMTTTDKCCDNMVSQVGKPCYDSLLKFTLKAQTFNDSKLNIIARAANIWSSCASIARTASPSPQPNY